MTINQYIPFNEIMNDITVCQHQLDSDGQCDLCGKEFRLIKKGRNQMKHVTIQAEFSELKGDNIANGQGDGSTVRAAISRAMADLFKQPNVKRKHISSFNASIVISTVAQIEVVPNAG